MKNPMTARARAAGACVLVLASMHVAAAPVQTIVESTNYGLLTLPVTQGFTLSIAQLPADDTFLADYGFSIGSTGTFTSAVVTFDLASTYQLTGLTLTLLSGDAWRGAVPSDLDSTQIADRDSRVIQVGGGNPTTQMIDQMTLASGNYVVEVGGQSVGTNGGTFSGLLNVAAVPEPAGGVLGFAGFALLAVRRRRGGR